jgi:hypothetical protein
MIDCDDQLVYMRTVRHDQYTRVALDPRLATWAAAGLPMAALAWVLAPWLAGVLEGPGAWPKAIVLSLTVGLAWQFVLVLLLVRCEKGSLRWSVVKNALWLRAPKVLEPADEVAACGFSSSRWCSWSRQRSNCRSSPLPSTATRAASCNRWPGTNSSLGIGPSSQSWSR